MASLLSSSNAVIMPPGGGPPPPGGFPGPPPPFDPTGTGGVGGKSSGAGGKGKKAQPKTRRLFWEKVETTSGAGGAIWNDVADMDGFVDRDEVEGLFGREAPSPRKKKSSAAADDSGTPAAAAAGTPKPKKEEKADSVFGEDLRQMEICFRGLKQMGFGTGESVVEAVGNIDSSAGFPIGACERLVTLLPTPTQLSTIQLIPREQMHHLDGFLHDIYQEIPARLMCEAWALTLALWRFVSWRLLGVAWRGLA